MEMDGLEASLQLSESSNFQFSPLSFLYNWFSVREYFLYQIFHVFTLFATPNLGLGKWQFLKNYKEMNARNGKETHMARQYSWVPEITGFCLRNPFYNIPDILLLLEYIW